MQAPVAAGNSAPRPRNSTAGRSRSQLRRHSRARVAAREEIRVLLCGTTSELSYPAKYCVDIQNLHAIEQTRSRRQRRVDGVGARNLIFNRRDGNALDGVHRQLELRVGPHQPDNCRRERHRIREDETASGGDNLSSLASDWAYNARAVLPATVDPKALRRTESQ